MFQTIKSAWGWVFHRISHKLHHVHPREIARIFKEHGLALVIIIVAWEIIEDIIFPAVFFFLGKYIHPVFLAGIPTAWLLCLHWVAVPALWGVWIRLSGKKEE